MTKSELIEKIAVKAKACTKAEVVRFMDALIELVGDGLKKGDKVAIAGLGIFSVKNRAARAGVNPKTGEKIQIAAARVPKFRACSGLKRIVKGK